MRKQTGFIRIFVLVILGALIAAGGVAVWKKKASPAPTSTLTPTPRISLMPTLPQEIPTSCTTSADCPPGLGVCIPSKCPTHRCIDGRCVYFKDAKDVGALCEFAGGTYKTFPTTCVDSCELARKGIKNLFCGEAMTDGCDCGPDRCWNGTVCEAN